jgi:hypothetical protein
VFVTGTLLELVLTTDLCGVEVGTTPVPPALTGTVHHQRFQEPLTSGPQKQPVEPPSVAFTRLPKLAASVQTIGQTQEPLTARAESVTSGTTG